MYMLCSDRWRRISDRWLSTLNSTVLIMDTKERLGLLDHFEFWFDETENAYRFDTETGVQYFVTLPYYAIFDANVYMLNIDRVIPNGVCKASRGTKIRNTILLILSYFFEEEDNALIAICETKDSLEHARHKLFDRWYRDAVNELKVDWIRRDDAPFTLSDGAQNYAMLYYHKDNSVILPLKTQFQELLYDKFYME